MREDNVSEYDMSDAASMLDTVPARARQYRVIVVEDEEEILNLTRRIVTRTLGCEVLEAADGDVALGTLALIQCDIMITDMMMPGTHGLELLERVRENHPDLAIIVMTGYGEDFPFVEVVQAGADDFILKPFSAAELQAKLLRIVRERELLRENILSQRKYRSLFDLSVDGMLLINRTDCSILDVNRAFHDLSGYAQGSLVGRSFFDLLEGENTTRFMTWLSYCNVTGHGTIGDLAMRQPGGSHIIADVSVTHVNVEGESLMFLSCKDVTVRREVDRQLAEAAQRDKLTGLYNKGAFASRIEWAVSRARMQETTLVLLMIDLDNFKRCNDTLGHPAGDKVLEEAGYVIRNSIRINVSDEGFRCGGDEFAVILPGASIAGGRIVAERMLAQYQQAKNQGTTMSIGMAELTPGITAAELIDKTDKALYQAKFSGKNQIYPNPA